MTKATFVTAHQKLMMEHQARMEKVRQQHTLDIEKDNKEISDLITEIQDQARHDREILE